MRTIPNRRSLKRVRLDTCRCDDADHPPSTRNFAFGVFFVFSFPFATQIHRFEGQEKQRRQTIAQHNRQRNPQNPTWNAFHEFRKKNAPVAPSSMLSISPGAQLCRRAIGPRIAKPVSAPSPIERHVLGPVICIAVSRFLARTALPCLVRCIQKRDIKPNPISSPFPIPSTKRSETKPKWKHRSRPRIQREACIRKRTQS